MATASPLLRRLEIKTSPSNLPVFRIVVFFRCQTCTLETRWFGSLNSLISLTQCSSGSARTLALALAMDNQNLCGSQNSVGSETLNVGLNWFKLVSCSLQKTSLIMLASSSAPCWAWFLSEFSGFLSWSLITDHWRL